MRRKGSLSLSTEEVAKAKGFAAMGYSTRHIGRMLHRSAHTVARLLKQPAVAVEVVTAKMELSDLYEQRARAILEAVTKKDIEAASLLQKATSSAIFLDKCRLLRGESTSNLSVQVLLDVAAEIRRADNSGENEIPRQATRILHAAPQTDPAEPVSRPTSRPRPQTQPIPSAPMYQSVPADPIRDEEYSPLTHGLRGR